MRKVLALAIAWLALGALPAFAAVDISLPPGTLVNFDGNGVFDQTKPITFDTYGPLPINVGAEMFGVGTISGVAATSDLGRPLWTPADEGAGFEMTFSFWDAVVTGSARTFTPDGQVLLSSSISDGAHLVLVADRSKDFTSAAGKSAFDTTTGDFPTAYTLPSGGAAADPDEELFLDLLLSGNSSLMAWRPGGGANGTFLFSSFTSTNVEIVGGSGASQFIDFFGGDGTANTFVLTFTNFRPGFAVGGDVDVQATTAIPEPAAMISLFSGLALLAGYRIHRRKKDPAEE